MDCSPPDSSVHGMQEYWSGQPFPSSGDLSNPGIEPGSPTLQADSLLSETSGKPDIPLKVSVNKSNFRSENGEILFQTSC